MLSFRRLAVTTAAVATLAVPAAAQARPDIQPVSQQPTIDKVSPDARYGVPAKTASTIDKVSPDARYGVPDATTPRFISVPQHRGRRGRQRVRLGRRADRRRRRSRAGPC